MATLYSNSTGNFTTAATWSLVDTTSFLDSETNNTSLTTSYVASASFTPGVITIDGIAIKVFSRIASPTATMSIDLFNASLAAQVSGSEVTINVTDVNVDALGFYFFKFSSPITLLAATNYQVRAKASATSNVNLMRNSTAGNWSRILRTTTTQAPAAADVLYIGGEFISAGVNNTFTVTIDNTATTTFGAVQIGNKGIFSFGTGASTAYYFKLAGDINVYGGGTFQLGTTSARVPSTSSATLEFVESSNVQYGLSIANSGTLQSGGAIVTARAFLTADAAAAATTVTTDVTTGWKIGDKIAFPSTTRTSTQIEARTLTSDSSGTTVTLPSGLTYAHSGTAPTQAELMNLTRNTKIKGTSTSLQCYIFTGSKSTTDLSYTEFQFIGSATASKRGLSIGTSTGGTFVADNCSFHNGGVTSSTAITTGSTANNITISNCVSYDIAGAHLNIPTTSLGTNILITNWYGIYRVSVGALIVISDGEVSGNGLKAASSSGTGIQFTDLTTGVFSNLTAHSNDDEGVEFTTLDGTTSFGPNTVTNITAWRNVNRGLAIVNVGTIDFTTGTLFGNGVSNLALLTTISDNLTFSYFDIQGGVTLTSPIGIALSIGTHQIVFESCTIGNVTTHSTGDVVVTAGLFNQVHFRNCIFGSSNEFVNPNSTIQGSYITSARHDQTSGNHKKFITYGTITSDSVIYRSAPLSARLAPNSALYKLEDDMKRIAIPSGSTATISVYVRKSVAGDGTAYNGNQPRLILKMDTAVHASTGDVVLATATNAANGAFELLTGTTPASIDNAAFTVVIDCDGTTGWVNVDDWKAS